MQGLHGGVRGDGRAEVVDPVGARLEDGRVAWPVGLPVRHAPGHGRVHPSLEALREVGGVLQGPLLVRVGDPHEVHDRPGLLELPQDSADPQPINAVMPDNQFLFAEFNHAVHATESTTFLLLPLERTSR